MAAKAPNTVRQKCFGVDVAHSGRRSEASVAFFTYFIGRDCAWYVVCTENEELLSRFLYLMTFPFGLPQTNNQVIASRRSGLFARGEDLFNLQYHVPLGPGQHSHHVVDGLRVWIMNGED